MGVKVVTVTRWYVQDEMNQDYSEQNEVDGMKKGADWDFILTTDKQPDNAESLRSGSQTTGSCTAPPNSHQYAQSPTSPVIICL